MKQHLIACLMFALLCGVFGLTPPVLADGGPAVGNAPSPLLVEVHASLLQLLQGYYPAEKATDSITDRMLSIAFQTRSYLVYNPLKTGEFADTPVTETGPKANGILLQLEEWHPGDPALQADMAQDSIIRIGPPSSRIIPCWMDTPGCA